MVSIAAARPSRNVMQFKRMFSPVRGQKEARSQCTCLDACGLTLTCVQCMIQIRVLMQCTHPGYIPIAQIPWDTSQIILVNLNKGLDIHLYRPHMFIYTKCIAPCFLPPLGLSLPAAVSEAVAWVLLPYLGRAHKHTLHICAEQQSSRIESPFLSPNTFLEGVRYRGSEK